MVNDPAGDQEDGLTVLLDDFRAMATAFSVLNGVLGGFCITILVVSIDSDSLKENPSAQDWVIGLVLLAAMAFIYASGILANSMNYSAARRHLGGGGQPRSKVLDVQRGFYNHGILAFQLGNFLLATVMVLIVYLHSWIVGVIAVTAIAILVLFVVFRNVLSLRGLIKS